MQDFEKLGAFYLGKVHDLDRGATREDLLLYDSKDLTTHAVCVGMTGSGKTGLCLALLEEAAIDRIPAIAIDPKGDLGNLLLTFPQLESADFRPWIDESAATRAGLSPDQFAEQTARRWRDGLAAWGQTPQRIARFRDSVDVAIYTPGSNAGLPLTVLRSFAAPPQSLLEDSDAFLERVSSATSGLLALLGRDADPVRSREHILVSNLLHHAWSEGRDLDIAALIREIQEPPFDKVGILDLETFFPSKDRLGLAMNLNNLLASPSFASWLEGDPLDVKSLLYTGEGKPRLSIISIAHLSDAERMFFVTILLNEVLAWVRSQSGTSSLRAVLYMDEVFGFFPPTANPPSKTPMLTLLKQARAFGLGIVLATQNPVDLDYKGLSNTGTWFLGRLQTERDKLRVLEGLEGASSQAGSQFDRKRMEATLAGLESRVFLMNNVHDDVPVVFHTRWALSYLRGPLTRSQIQLLMGPRKQQQAQKPGPAPPLPPAKQKPPARKGKQEKELAARLASQAQEPKVAPAVDQLYLLRHGLLADGCHLVYQPAMLARARLHFVRATYHVDLWKDRCVLLPIADQESATSWQAAEMVDPQTLQFTKLPEADAAFAPLPDVWTRDAHYARLRKELLEHLYRTETVAVLKCVPLKMHSQPDESEGDFQIRLVQAAHEKRDLEVEKLRKRFAGRLATLKKRIDTAEQRVTREKSQYHQASYQSALSIGSSLMGALLGRKLASRTNINKTSSSMRSMGRAVQQRSDVTQAKQKLETLNRQMAKLQQEFENDVQKIERAYDSKAWQVETVNVRPRKSEIEIAQVALLWMPWQVDDEGKAEPIWGSVEVQSA